MRAVSSSADNTNYISVLLEDMRDQNRAVLEAVGDMQKKVNNLPTRGEFNELKRDTKIIKAAVAAR